MPSGNKREIDEISQMDPVEEICAQLETVRIQLHRAWEDRRIFEERVLYLEGVLDNLDKKTTERINTYIR